MSEPALPHIVVAGAGTLGCYLGGRLTEGAKVTLIGRAWLMDALANRGLTIGMSGEGDVTMPVDGDRLSTTVDHRAAKDADIVLVTVKTYDNAAMAETLKRRLRPGVPVISIQNGVRNHEQLSAIFGEANPVIPAVLGYNVVHSAPTTFHQASAGVFRVGNHPDLAPFYRAAEVAHLGLEACDDIAASQHSKLLLNLNGAVNALSGLSLRAELSSPQFRQVLALSQKEALAAYRAAGISCAKLAPISSSSMVKLLGLPTWLFMLFAQANLDIQNEARMSMSEDLARGRRTEIAEFQGYISELGREHGVPTPVCDTLVRLMGDAERAASSGVTPKRWGAAELLNEVRKG